MAKVKRTSALRRANERKALRGARAELRAQIVPLEDDATIRPRTLEACMQMVADKSSVAAPAPEKAEQSSPRASAAAQRTRVHNRSREERERAATYATLRAQWKIAHNEKEERSLERANQWREAFAPATGSSPRRPCGPRGKKSASGASGASAEYEASDDGEAGEIAAVSDDDGAAPDGAGTLPSFGDDAEADLGEGDFWKIVERVDDMMDGGESGVSERKQSSASVGSASASVQTSILFGDDADACAGAKTPPPEAGGFVQPLFGDDVMETASGASGASDASGAIELSDNERAGGDDGDKNTAPPDGDQGGGAAAGEAPFEGLDEGEAVKAAKAVDEILGCVVKLGWADHLLTWGAKPQLGIMKRTQRARKRLMKASVGQLGNMRRASMHLIDYLESNGLTDACEERVGPDTLIDSLEEYDECARARAQQRAVKRSAKNLPPRRNDRGGATATMPIFLGYSSLEKKLGLPVEASNSPEVKATAKAGPGMPAVRPMMNLKTANNLGLATLDKKRSEYERAYAGGGWILQSASTRVIDLQRTPKIRFETSKVLGTKTVIACGTARKSKARGQLEMRPLAWRAPLIPMTGDSVDLEPLIKSMPDSENGCVFRDFVTPADKPHTINHAIGWANHPASHDTIVNSLRIVGDDPDLGGHDGRHVNAEIGRALELPRHVREALGYWRVQPVIGDSANDAAAIARATTKARERRTRAGALASCADRYASVDAQAVEQDKARAACQLAARELFANGADQVPDSTREQIEAIAAACGDK